MNHPYTPGIQMPYIPRTRGINRKRTTKKKNGNNNNETSPMDLGDDSNKTHESKTDGKTKKKSQGHYYNCLVYHTNVTGQDLLLSILQTILT